MLLLINFLLLNVSFRSTPLDSFQGKWAVGLSVLGCDELSVLWTPVKTFAIGMSGSFSGNATTDGYLNEYTYDHEYKSGHIGIGIYKYFMTKSLISPFIGLSPYVSMNYESYKYFFSDGDTDICADTSYSLGATFNPGAEYFCKLGGKQLSLRIMASLVSFSRNYHKGNIYQIARPMPMNDIDNYSSGAENYWRFYSPTEIPISVYLLLHL